MQTMSVTRALAELKRLDDRIKRASEEGVFVAVTTGKNVSMKVYEAQMTVDAVKSKIQESFDKLDSMFVSRASMKAALVLSNAKTTIKVFGRDVTVAEAIEMKTSVVNKKVLLQRLKNQHLKCSSTVMALNSKLDDTIELNLKTIYGSDKSKADPAAYESIAKPQREQKEAALLDPKNILKQISDLEEEISMTETELDFLLSESNAKTEISF